MINKKIIIIFLFCLALLAGLFLYIKIDSSRAKSFEIIFLNVGQGDSALIKFENGEKMLVDCGVDSSVLYGLGEYLPFYDRKIDRLLITHPDNDHYGGCADVLRRYDVKEIITNGDEKPGDPYWSIFKKYVESEDAKQIVIDNYKIVNWGGVKIEFLSPDNSLPLEEKDKKDNNRSIVFRLSHKDLSAFFAADMETPLENAILQKYCLEFSDRCPILFSDYLKVGHHGSDSSGGDNFLSAVSPSTAIISVGKNSFGHPSFRVLKKLERLGAEIWRTDDKGDLVIRAD